MTLLLKVMSHASNSPDDDSRAEHSLYTDITSCHFIHNADGSGSARVWVREPIKTALVPGFVENEKNIDIPGNAYLMNENGKTVSTFTARGLSPVARPCDIYEDGFYWAQLTRSKMWTGLVRQNGEWFKPGEGSAMHETSIDWVVRQFWPGPHTIDIPRPPSPSELLATKTLGELPYPLVAAIKRLATGHAGEDDREEVLRAITRARVAEDV